MHGTGQLHAVLECTCMGAILLVRAEAEPGLYVEGVLPTCEAAVACRTAVCAAW